MVGSTVFTLHANFDNFISDYLNKSGFLNTAECFQNEARIMRVIPPEFDHYPRGILYDVWSHRGSSSQNQAPNVAAIIDTTPQIIREGYSIQHLSRFESNQRLFLSCDFSSDGKIVASGGPGMKPFICYIETRQSVTTSEAHSLSILDVRFKPGSNMFATSSADKTVKVWDANRTARLLFSFVGHNASVRSLDFNPFKETLCSSDNYDEIKVWDLNRKCKIASYMEGGSIVRFQPGSGTLLAVAKRNVITILDSKSMGVKYRLQGHTKNICSLCWSAGGKTIASVSDDDVRVWSLSLDGQCTYEYPSKGNMFASVVFHPRHRNVLVVGGFQWMELLILENGQIRCISAFSSRSGKSVPGLAACTENESIATTHKSVVNIWK
ncbi:transcriptional corepressor LEUNIG-like isoform X2 [Trifolium pratense]|uniref:transcriptional corepressor LEUNIG-like isoform X2 n=1 Tax=Trifolium pratense TaxID=57577 RepID=UPI001E690D0F|nr:transcriptional corepressor LEUNIG-like isoform X2 [Trifolium pratense]